MRRFRTAILSGRLSIPLAVATCARPAASHADDKVEGRRRFKDGQELFRQGKYLEAAHEFEAGFAAAPRPLFLLNIGHSYRRAQEFRKAKRAYERLLQLEPTTPFRAEVESLMRAIDDALLGTGPLPPAPAVATTAGSPIGGSARPSVPEPPGAPAPAQSPSSVLLSGGDPAAPADLDPTLDPLAETGAGGGAPPSFLVSDPPPAPPGAESGSVLRSPWFWAAVGVAAVALSSVAYLGLRSGNSACSADYCFPER